MEHKVIDIGGKKVGALELNDSVFAVKPKPELVHEVVVWQLAKRRSGTHSTLTRSMMKGGGKKPFKQKGTGNARAGSILSPLWVGGAVTFGPHPRNYEKRMPARTKRQALCSVLSDKIKSEKLVILDSLKSSGKTKDMVGALEKLGVRGKKALFILNADSNRQDPVQRSLRNITRVNLLSLNGINVYDVLNAEFVLATKETIKAIEGKLLGETSAKEKSKA